VIEQIPLSSIGFVPLTTETREKLIAIGVPEDTLFRLSEIGGQSVLALRAAEDGEDSRPDCYASYDPTNPLCAGCLWSPRCWSSSPEYLRELQAGRAARPVGVPDQFVDERLGAPVPPLPPTPVPPAPVAAAPRPRVPPLPPVPPMPPPPPR
jgi:hypothetical protein